MKMTKTFYCLITSLVISVFLSFGCSSSDSNPTGGTDALVGTWDVTTVTITMEGGSPIPPIAAADLSTWVTLFPELGSIPSTIILNADGTYNVTYASGDNETGTWTATENTISVTAQGETEADDLPYTLSGNTATITFSVDNPEMGTVTIQILYTKR